MLVYGIGPTAALLWLPLVVAVTLTLAAGGADPAALIGLWVPELQDLRRPVAADRVLRVAWDRGALRDVGGACAGGSPSTPSRGCSRRTGTCSSTGRAPESWMLLYPAFVGLVLAAVFAPSTAESSPTSPSSSRKLSAAVRCRRRRRAVPVRPPAPHDHPTARALPPAGRPRPGRCARPRLRDRGRGRPRLSSGSNGAGKTTLLRMLCRRATAPETGHLDRRPPGSLLSSMPASAPQLTGRENADAARRAPGLTRPERAGDRRVRSERPGRGLRHPVPSYSQGMRARLGFRGGEQPTPGAAARRGARGARPRVPHAGWRTGRARQTWDGGGIVVAAGHDHAEAVAPVHAGPADRERTGHGGRPFRDVQRTYLGDRRP